MEAVHRIEIIIPQVALGDVMAVLGEHHVDGYTVTRGLVGVGDRGPQPGDGLTGEFSNASVLVVCAPARSAPLLEALRPVLKRFGGLCLLSDTLSLKH